MDGRNRRNSAKGKQLNLILRVKLRLKGWARGEDAQHRGHWAS